MPEVLGHSPKMSEESSIHKPRPVMAVPQPVFYAPWQFFYLMSDYYGLCHKYVANQFIYKKNITDLEDQIKILKERNRRQKQIIEQMKYKDCESYVANTLVSMKKK